MELSINKRELRKIIPADCFQRSDILAWRQVFYSLFLGVSGTLLINAFHWSLIPLGWFFVGLSIAGQWSLAHECTHNAFFEKPRMNYFMGHIMALSSLYPFVSFKQGHILHHQNLNHIEKDSVWRPESYFSFQKKSFIYRAIYRLVRGYGWWLGAFFHVFLTHYHFSHEGRAEMRTQARIISVVISQFFLLALFVWCWRAPTLFVLNFLIPWLVFSIIISTISAFQHTNENAEGQASLPWRHDDTFNPLVESHTVDLEIPRFMEFFIHSLNLHVLHHLYPTLPCYHLQRAQETICQHLGSKPWITRKIDWLRVPQTLKAYEFYDTKSHRLISLEQVRNTK